MKKLWTAFAVLAAASATPAFAEAPSGVRTEVLVGWDRASLDLNDYGLGTYSEDGVGFGLAVGYDIPTTGSVAFGVDAEISDSSTKTVYDDGVDRAVISTGRDLYVGARVTAAVNPKLNLYGKVGYTNARIKGELNGFKDAANGDGVRLGLGAQLGLGGNSYGLVEYRYSNYEAGFSRNQVLAGLGLRF
ncbi:outer membrane beta-barrel protein [Novosphingobium jiangmenense]|uniref:Outer membrane beta-barrel protein n=1 Tax=Novosphingobium jiangmenense TaxID=2791981 RepID=A0ABS0HKY2_9SPHN|nr:outer membrane beta-barrel protein [Novosphingobium jiangmenense]MBF9152675.1 outer membrane beta-barrel protein [Novosphingobium jiangmenense]